MQLLLRDSPAKTKWPNLKPVELIHNISQYSPERESMILNQWDFSSQHDMELVEILAKLCVLVQTMKFFDLITTNGIFPIERLQMRSRMYTIRQN